MGFNFFKLYMSQIKVNYKIIKYKFTALTSAFLFQQIEKAKCFSVAL